MKIAAMTLMAAMVGVAAEPRLAQQKLIVRVGELAVRFHSTRRRAAAGKFSDAAGGADKVGASAGLAVASGCSGIVARTCRGLDWSAFCQFGRDQWKCQVIGHSSFANDNDQ